MAPTATISISPSPTSTVLSGTTISAITSTVPQAPPAGSIYTSSDSDKWSPSAIIGIVAAIVLLCLCVPLIAIILRRCQKKRLTETISSSASTKASSLRSIKEDQSLKSILVTRELQRSSLRVVEGVGAPEKALVQDRGWSRTEVRGGEWK